MLQCGNTTAGRGVIEMRGVECMTLSHEWSRVVVYIVEPFQPIRSRPFHACVGQDRDDKRHQSCALTRDCSWRGAPSRIRSVTPTTCTSGHYMYLLAAHDFATHTFSPTPHLPRPRHTSRCPLSTSHLQQLVAREAHVVFSCNSVYHHGPLFLVAASRVALR